MTAIVENVNVQPGTDTISDPIQLQFLAAKLTLTVTDATLMDMLSPFLDGTYRMFRHAAIFFPIVKMPIPLRKEVLIKKNTG